MPNWLFPASFTPCCTGILALGIAHTAGLAIRLQAQLSATRGAAGTALRDLLGASRSRHGIGRCIAIWRNTGAERTIRAGNAGCLNTNATTGRLARGLVGLAAASEADVVWTTGLGARWVGGSRRPIGVVRQPRGTDGRAARPRVWHGSESGLADATGTGQSCQQERCNTASTDDAEDTHESHRQRE